MQWVDIVGYAASIAVLATFCMSTMIPLRILALCSNVLFSLYGYFDQLYPVLALHLILFPVNLYRLIELKRMILDVERAATGDLSLQALLPFMKKREIAEGETLTRKGEPADRLYYLAEGELTLPDVGKIIQPGAVIGEIGVFARNRTRTATVVAATACRLYELTSNSARQLYYQDRSFGFAMLNLIIERLAVGESSKGNTETIT